MKLVVVLEHHFVRCPEGVFTPLAFGYTFWQEYLTVFDEVCVIARMGYKQCPPEDTLIASGENVTFYDMTDYCGMWDFMLKFFPFVWKAMRVSKLGDSFILFSGNVGVVVWLNLILRRKRYFFRCVGNVQLGIATENKNFLYKYIANVYHFITKMQAKYARASSYTSDYLRRIYPNKYNNEYVFSNVELLDCVFAKPKTMEDFREQPFHFISVGRVEKQKGHQWLLQSVKHLKEQSLPIPWTVSIVGPGSQIEPLQSYVNTHKLHEYVTFHGSVKWGKPLFDFLDKAHVFVLPSLTEGMSRALLEGMARGLPAIASNTGGNPEVVSQECLVGVGNIVDLAEKMKSFMLETSKLVELSRSNWETAQMFKHNSTKQKFLRYIYENTSPS